MKIKCDIPIGEFLDKISILRIKILNMVDPLKVLNVQKELDILEGLLSFDPLTFIDELQVINSNLWEVEDSIRALERVHDFSNDFIQLARQVYILNDKRALLKNKISIYFNSNIIEQKSYGLY